MYEYNATVTRVIDGDTVEAMVDLGFCTHVNLNFRLFGIDTPEMHSTNLVEREKAQAAKNRLIDLIEGKDVVVRTHKADKYGRWLAEIKVVGSTDIGTVNTQLIAEGLAKQYFGVGPKPSWQ